MNKIDSVEIHTEKQRTEDDKKYKEQIKTTQQKFAALNQLVLRDLNNDRNTPSFFLYTKDEINTYLSNPYRYQAQLRNAVIYMYSASSHFRRIIQYFVGLTDLSYIVSPYNVDISSVSDTKKIKKNYTKILHTVNI